MGEDRPLEDCWIGQPTGLKWRQEQCNLVMTTSLIESLCASFKTASSLQPDRDTLQYLFVVLCFVVF